MCKKYDERESFTLGSVQYHRDYLGGMSKLGIHSSQVTKPLMQHATGIRRLGTRCHEEGKADCSQFMACMTLQGSNLQTHPSSRHHREHSKKMRTISFPADLSLSGQAISRAAGLLGPCHSAPGCKWDNDNKGH